MHLDKLSFLQPAGAGRAAALPGSWYEGSGHARRYSECKTPADYPFSDTQASLTQT